MRSEGGILPGNQMKISRRGIVYIFFIIGILFGTLPLIKQDHVIFIVWWLMVLVIGVAFLPLSYCLFEQFADRGWIFSKALGIAISGFVVWALASMDLVNFTRASCLGAVIFGALLCWGIRIYQIHRGNAAKFKFDGNLILGEELLFLMVFLLWTYLSGFRPEAHGTEKFMDYGFMAAMMRSKKLPAADIWYAGKEINYYYGGQYYAVFLTKLSAQSVENTYNLMRALVAALLFCMSFSIVSQLMRGLQILENPKFKKIISCLSGLLSAGCVVFAGNLHYLIYGVFGKFFGWNSSADYFFPDSTRYIGYNPETNDKCIHEFPAYSFVLGDLHAHVVNTMFVSLIIGLLLSWVLKIKDEKEQDYRWDFKHFFFDPHVLTAGFLVGLFQFMNYWDFVIYVTLAIICLIYVNLFRSRHARIKSVIRYTIIQSVELFLIAEITALPFALHFKNMVSGVGIVKHHTPIHQWLILWGLPAFVVLLFTICVFVHYKGFLKFLRNGRTSDVFAFIMGMCALGLVLIPEVFYIRDIYEDGYARSNTMFKLTYQAFILFGLSVGYIIVRFLTGKKSRILKAAGVVSLVLVVSTFGYFHNASVSWFGDVKDPKQYQCLNATSYIENTFESDAAAIRWMNKNIKGNPVVLEANGDSYSDYCRVSAMTGLPTVLGWYVHEWLWRSDPADLDMRAKDIETIYTSQDTGRVLDLLKKYNVCYIYVGQYEREKYSRLNDQLLRNLGVIVYEDDEFKQEKGLTYLIKVNQMA